MSNIVDLEYSSSMWRIIAMQLAAYNLNIARIAYCRNTHDGRNFMKNLRHNLLIFKAYSQYHPS
jgi:anaerobic ribonucleoside-triphosphate reductase